MCICGGHGTWGIRRCTNIWTSPSSPGANTTQEISDWLLDRVENAQTKGCVRSGVSTKG